MSGAAGLTFEETLAALHGMLGGEVEISVGAAEGPPAIAGTWSGRLAAGSELPARRSPEGDGTFYFHFAEDAGSGFFVHAGAFRGARWLEAEAGANAMLEIHSGPLVLVIERP